MVNIQVVESSDSSFIVLRDTSITCMVVVAISFSFDMVRSVKVELSSSLAESELTDVVVASDTNWSSV